MLMMAGGAVGIIMCYVQLSGRKHWDKGKYGAMNLKAVKN